VNTPSNDDIFSAKAPVDFTNLKASTNEKNNPLNNRPSNHMLQQPRTFEMAEGAQSIQASVPAWKIIESIQQLVHDADSDEQTALLEQEKEGMKILLA
jgi:hypothetical protein